MSDISGFIDFQKITAEDVLEKRRRTMAYRGPVGEGYCIYATPRPSIDRVYRRCCIIDITSPFYYENFTGEICNFSEIKIEKEQKGHYSESYDDREVILKFFKKAG